MFAVIFIYIRYQFPEKSLSFFIVDAAKIDGPALGGNSDCAVSEQLCVARQQHRVSAGTAAEHGSRRQSHQAGRHLVGYISESNQGLPQLQPGQHGS